MSSDSPSPIRPLEKHSQMEIHREHLLRLVKTLLDPAHRLVFVEGEEGMGKTTILRQFARENADQCFGLSVSAVGRWAYDARRLQFVLCSQMELRLLGKELDVDATIDDARLMGYYLTLDRRALRQGKPFYFVIDGLEDIPAEDEISRKQILDFLPLGFEGFRFLFSGPSDHLFPQSRAQNYAKPFPLPFLTLDETTKLLSPHSLTDRQLKEIYRTTRGVPGHLSSVNRILLDTQDVDAFLDGMPDALPDLFRIEWSSLRKRDALQTLILAVMAHENVRLTVPDLSALLGASESAIEESIRGVRFVEEDHEGRLAFVSEAYRRYTAKELKELNGQVTDIFIEHYRRQPDSDEALVNLPSFFVSANRLNDLLAYLSPERFARLFQTTGSLRLVQKKADDAISAARQLGRDDDQMRFALQKCAITEIASSQADVAEVSARTAGGDYATALALVD